MPPTLLTEVSTRTAFINTKSQGKHITPLSLGEGSGVRL